VLAVVDLLLVGADPNQQLFFCG